MDLIERLRAVQQIRRDQTPLDAVVKLCHEAADKLHELLRWKSTHAPRIETLEYLLSAAQREAAAGREAIASLASERAANEALTNEVERLRADVAAERERCAKLCEGMRMPAWVETTGDVRDALAEAIRKV